MSLIIVIVAALAIAVFAYVMPGFRRAWVAFVGIASGVFALAFTSFLVTQPTSYFGTLDKGVFIIAGLLMYAATMLAVGVKVARKGV